jgi:hypothetical protein
MKSDPLFGLESGYTSAADVLENYLSFKAQLSVGCDIVHAERPQLWLYRLLTRSAAPESAKLDFQHITYLCHDGN